MKWFGKRLSEASSYPSIGMMGYGIEQASTGNWQSGIIPFLLGLLGFAMPEQMQEFGNR
jgi:hypothetical protein